MRTYSKGTLDRLFAPSTETIRNLNLFMLERDIENLETELYDNPSSKYESLPGPKCNYNRCSNIQGCSSECVCIPYGWYGHRCIPKCCIRAGNAGPCHIEHPGMKIQCALPCHTYPMFCNELAFNPYHKYQGGSLQFPKYGGFK
jgi:hypothetical protein